MTSETITNMRSVNSASVQMLRQTLEFSEDYGLEISMVAGATVVQFAATGMGVNESGVILAKLCLGLDGQVDLIGPQRDQVRLPHVRIETDNPLVACMGCQYAGWPLKSGDYFAMASGPVRLLRGKEAVLEEYNLTQADTAALVVLESNKLPDAPTIRTIAAECQLPTDQIFVCVARTSSIPGRVQVVARSVETSLHKLHEIGFDLSTINSGVGTAPLPPDTQDDMLALGWTNDSMLYGAEVELIVDTEDDAIADVIDRAPSQTGDEFGSPFLEIFKKYDYDFYKIDKMLFSPARIAITNVRTGKVFQAGETRRDILNASFGLA